MTKPRPRTLGSLSTQFAAGLSPLLQISGWLFLVYAVVALAASAEIGLIVLGLALFLVLPAYSFQASLYLAKAGAWVGTVGRS